MRKKRLLRKGSHDRFFLIFAVTTAVYLGACGGPSSSEAKTDSKTEKLIREGRCRVLRTREANPLQCKVPRDCGVRPHVVDFWCLHGFCLPGCEEHWGNCNRDYLDGCETPIKHPVFCDGDERINPAYGTFASTFLDGVGTGPGRFDDMDFARAMDDQSDQLDKCYKEVLNHQPALESSLRYEFTLGENGKIIKTKLVKNDPGSDPLQACVANIIERLHFDPGPVGGSVTYKYRINFITDTTQTDARTDGGK
jgi:hypothetical protein